MPSSEDEELVMRAKAGDKLAFAEVWDKYAYGLYTYLSRMLNNIDESKDQLQETFITAWKTLSTLSNDASFKAWIFAIATHKAIDVLRRKKRILMESLEDEAKCQLRERLIETNLEDQVITALLTRQALQQVSEDHRACILLKMIGGLRAAEIAQQLHLSEANVHKMIQRGTQQFREAYQQLEDEAKADTERRS